MRLLEFLSNIIRVSLELTHSRLILTKEKPQTQSKPQIVMPE